MALLRIPVAALVLGGALLATRAPCDPPPPVGEAAEVARLQALPASHVPLKGATLSSAIRLLAQSAHMSYIAPPDADFPERVTSDVVMNPFELLKLFQENYNFGMEYRRDVWWFYRINLNELVTKSYTLRFNNLQHVSISGTSINSQLAAMGGMSSGMGGGGSSTPSAGSGGSGHSTFSTKSDKVIEDIRKILSVPTVGLMTPALDGSSAIPGIGANRKGVEAPKVEPIWNPDTSQLFVVATRQQHSLIAAYLKTIDQPQKLIRIAVKFVETARNPQQSLGVDWTQTFLGSGGPISLSGSAISSAQSVVSTSGLGTVVTTTNTSTTSNGSGTNSSSSTSASGGSGASSTTSSNASGNTLASVVNLNHPGNIQLPLALLSAPTFQWTIQAIAADRFSSIVQDPVIYTSNNREVSFKATSQQPIQEGTTTIGAATAATTSQIAYIDVGTELTILPCILPGSGQNKELVQLNLSINVSSITGEQVINGNPYPVTSSRTYSYSVAIPNGETLAIAGLEERSRQTTDNKVPLFGDLPLVGYAFKNKSDSVVHTTLLAFITPELIRTDDAAGEEEPAAAPIPQMRHRLFEGSPSETLTQVSQSLEGLPADIAALQACASAGNRSAVLNRLDRIAVEIALMDVRLGELRLANDKLTAPASAKLASAQEQLDACRSRVAAIPSGPR